MAGERPRFVMMPATRDAITRLFERPGRVVLERDDQGKYWAGLGTRDGHTKHHGGKTIVDAVEAALTDPVTVPPSLLGVTR